MKINAVIDPVSLNPIKTGGVADTFSTCKGFAIIFEGLRVTVWNFGFSE